MLKILYFKYQFNDLSSSLFNVLFITLEAHAIVNHCKTAKFFKKEHKVMKIQSWKDTTNRYIIDLEAVYSKTPRFINKEIKAQIYVTCSGSPYKFQTRLTSSRLRMYTRDQTLHLKTSFPGL